MLLALTSCQTVWLCYILDARQVKLGTQQGENKKNHNNCKTIINHMNMGQINIFKAKNKTLQASINKTNTNYSNHYNINAYR